MGKEAASKDHLVSNQNERRLYEISKRIIDVTVSILALVLLSPLWLLITALIRLTSPGPAIYRTQTVGKDSRPFTLYKFRTMYIDNDESEHRHWLEEFVEHTKPYAVIEDRDCQKKPIYKVIKDSRVTPLGRILRKSGLDEAPQFLNVLKGEMSVVGPRSPRVFEYEHYTEREKRRVEVLPGITGLYQVTGRSVVPFDEMVRIDLEYIEKRSLWLDLKIMLKTIPVMIMGKGGY